MDKDTESELRLPVTTRKPRYYIPSMDTEEKERPVRRSGTGTYTHARRRRSYKASTPSPFLERLIAQAKLSVIILGVLLLISFVDIGVTRQIKQALKSAITTNVSLEQVIEVASGFTDSVKTIFGFQSASPGYDDGINEIKQQLEPETTPIIEPTPENPPKTVPEIPDTNGIRIDEDILEEIINSDDPYIKN